MTSTQTSPTVPAGARRRPRRAFSLVEAVMAAALLAIIASAIVGGITTVVAADTRNQRKLEGLELANRLLLQYLDDETAMPDASLHLVQGGNAYRWTIEHAAGRIAMPQGGLLEAPAGDRGNALDKVELTIVSVYAGVPDGMGGFAQGERVCTLSRLTNPLSAMMRNPDTAGRAISDPASVLKRFGALLAPSSPRTGPGPAVAGAFSGARAKEDGR